MNFLLSFTDSSIILWDFNMNFILSFTENNNTEKLEENENLELGELRQETDTK